MRYKIEGVFKDGNGKVIQSGTATFYLSGTTTLATIYAAATLDYSDSAVTGSVVATDANGRFVAYVDDFDYGTDQTYKVVLTTPSTLPSYSITYDNIRPEPVLGDYTSVSATISLPISIPKGVTYNGTLTFAIQPTIGDYQVFNVAATVTGLEYARLSWFGAAADGTTDDSAVIIAAHAAAYVVKFTVGKTYAIASTITLDDTRPFVFESDIEGGATLKWTGAAGGTMFNMNDSWSTFRNLILDGNSGNADNLIIFGSDTTSSVTHNNLEGLQIKDAAANAIQLGNYAVTGVDTDVSHTKIRNCRFWNNAYGIYYDSLQALVIDIYDSQFTKISGTTRIVNHIKVERGGGFNLYGGYIGSSSLAGDTFAIYVKDGHFNIFGANIEFGYTGTAGGGIVHLDTPTVETYQPTNIIGVTVYSVGQTGTGYLYKITSVAHPLNLSGNRHYGKSGGSLPTVAIRNDGGAQVTSTNNTYVGYIVNIPYGFYSMGDRYDDGSDVYPLAPRGSFYKDVVGADSPYTAETIYSTFAVDATASDIVFNLQPIAGFNLTHNTITVRLIATAAAHTVTLTPDGAETINGAASLALDTAGELITLQHNGSNVWRTVNYYKP